MPPRGVVYVSFDHFDLVRNRLPRYVYRCPFIMQKVQFGRKSMPARQIFGRKQIAHFSFVSLARLIPIADKANMFFAMSVGRGAVAKPIHRAGPRPGQGSAPSESACPGPRTMEMFASIRDIGTEQDRLAIGTVRRAGSRAALTAGSSTVRCLARPFGCPRLTSGLIYAGQSPPGEVHQREHTGQLPFPGNGTTSFDEEMGGGAVQTRAPRHGGMAMKGAGLGLEALQAFSTHPRAQGTRKVCTCSANFRRKRRPARPTTRSGRSVVRCEGPSAAVVRAGALGTARGDYTIQTGRLDRVWRQMRNEQCGCAGGDGAILVYRAAPARHRHGTARQRHACGRDVT